MADIIERRSSGTGAVAAVAIVVLVLLALGAGWVLFFNGADRGVDLPSVNIEVPNPD